MPPTTASSTGTPKDQVAGLIRPPAPTRGAIDLDAAQRLGRTGDEGLDGVIYEDRLGLDMIYVRAKRWSDRVVRRPDVQAFVGALQGARAQGLRTEAGR